MFLKISLVILLSSFCMSIIHCWDLAVTSGNQINLIYSNGTVDRDTTIFERKNNDIVKFNTITYDPIDHRLFTIANQSTIKIIYLNHNDTTTAIIDDLITFNNNNNNGSTNTNMESIHYEPFTNTLYWIEDKHRIIKMNVNTKQIQQVVQFNSNEHELTSLTTHSCQGYIFWTNSKLRSPKIQRSTLFGGNVQTIIKTDMYFPTAITVDQQSDRIYWTDDTDGEHYLIEMADLNGNDRQQLLHARHHHPFGIVQNQQQIFWIDFNEIWTWYKNDTTKTPHQLSTFKDMVQMTSLTSPFVPKEQCYLAAVATTTTTTTTTMVSSTSLPTNDNQTTITTIECLNNGKPSKNVHGKTICKCAAAYTGTRCEIPACHNYCITGVCSLNYEDRPECECSTGYTGLRCEINICDQYCLNDGHCSIHTNNNNNMNSFETHCTCLDGFTGERCEHRNDSVAELCRIICEQHDLNQILKTTQDDTTSLCKCLVYDINLPASSSSQGAGERQEASDSESESDSTYGMLTKLQDPFVIVLIVLVICLIPINMALTTAVCWLRKRPRIKRRIIVNKNVTPLTCRPLAAQPEQCEITIENCCNMNICETPCFEPPQLRTSSKSSKTEEKKTLLTNMENGDDFY